MKPGYYTVSHKKRNFTIMYVNSKGYTRNKSNTLCNTIDYFITAGWKFGDCFDSYEEALDSCQGTPT